MTVVVLAEQRRELIKLIRGTFGNMPKQLTRTAQNALHLWFEQVAEELNNKGITQRMLLEKINGIDVPCSKESIKDLWKAIQSRYIGKKSTTSLTSGEIDKIYDALNKALGERLECHVPFPDRLQLMQNND